MACGGPSFQFQNQDLFSADNAAHEWDDRDPEVSLKIYGATGGSLPLQKTKASSGLGPDEIPLHEFQFDNHKDPLIVISSERSVGNSRYIRASTSLQSLNSLSSSVTNISVLSYNQYDSWVHHPKVRENWRLVLASGILMVLGLVLIFTGIGIAVSPATGYHCIVIIVIGLLCLIPGGYHFIYIYCAAIGRAGFDFNNLPALR